MEDEGEKTRYLLAVKDGVTEKYKCSLCFDGARYKQLRHIEQLHYGHAVTFEEHIIVLCKKGCHKESHYHCFVANRYFQKRKSY